MGRLGLYSGLSPELAPKDAATMRTKANLEMTFEDYAAAGSSEIKEFNGVRGKPLHEMYDDAQLLQFVRDEVQHVEYMHKKVLDGDEAAKQILVEVLLRGFLIPNINYLRRIGRLPAEFADLDPAAKFALPT